MPYKGNSTGVPHGNAASVSLRHSGECFGHYSERIIILVNSLEDITHAMYRSHNIDSLILEKVQKACTILNDTYWRLYDI